MLKKFTSGLHNRVDSMFAPLRMHYVNLIVSLVLAAALIPVASPALELPEIHGFVQGNYAPRVSGSPNDDFILAEERLQLEAQRSQQALNARAFFKVDFLHDAVDDEADLELREAHIDFSLGKFDFQFGRQMITWGLGDLIFINDAFPKDFTALFSGRPMEYLKIPSDAFRIGFYPDYFSAELVIVPFFEPDKLPDGKRLIFFDPLSAVPTRRVVEPDEELDNTEAAFRLQKNISNYELALYAFRGFFKRPGARLPQPNTVELFYPRLISYGASVQGTARGGVGKVEAGYYDSREDTSGTDPSVENSSFLFLLGYEKELATDLTIGLQHFGRWMLKYDEYRAALPPSIPAEDRFRYMSTLRITYLLKHHTLKLSLFTFFSPTDGDFYLIPEVKYNLTDQLSLTLGGNIFGGEKEHTFFGQLNPNDNVYTLIRYTF